LVAGDPFLIVAIEVFEVFDANRTLVLPSSPGYLLNELRNPCPQVNQKIRGLDHAAHGLKQVKIGVVIALIQVLSLFEVLGEDKGVLVDSPVLDDGMGTAANFKDLIEAAIEEVDLERESPFGHVVVKILQVGIVVHRFQMWLPVVVGSKFPDQGCFAGPDISGHCYVFRFLFVHALSLVWRERYKKQAYICIPTLKYAMSTLLIQNAKLVNEGKITEADLLIENERISQIAPSINRITDQKIDARGLYLLPGVIDDQVHFREPGLTHKADLTTESRAAAAGGITSYMEMPNTVPQTLTQELLQAKYERAAAVSTVNYSFFMGASNDNLEEVLKTDPRTVCGIKVFMGSSTGNMLVDDEEVLDNIFRQAPMLVATHCEKEEVIRRNQAEYVAKYGEDIPVEYHPLIRSEEACYLSSSKAVELARRHNTRLHILHISTARELDLFRNDIPLAEKRITAEACIHHLWFSEEDYAHKGKFIKWNPAVKRAADRAAIRAAVNDGRIDVVATDHAPHTLEEKDNPYTKAPSGAPLVQHSLVTMLEMVHQGVFTLPHVVQKMAHDPAICFQIEERGYLREGYFADLVLVDLNGPWTVDRSNVLYKCGWSPLEGQTFQARVHSTLVNGYLVYQNGQLGDPGFGKRLTFNRS
jgi:dihydroorotase